jgi:cellobiose-specific phosphotransferase system component IIA
VIELFTKGSGVRTGSPPGDAFMSRIGGAGMVDASDTDDSVDTHAVLMHAEDRMVRDLSKEGAESGNPLLLLSALAHALRLALEKAMKQAEDAVGVGVEAVKLAHAADHQVTLPESVHRYLRNALWRLDELEAGLDFRDYPSNLPARWSPEHAREYRNYRSRRAYSGQPIAPDVAARLVAQALWITTPGYNAFRASQRRHLARTAQSEEDYARECGESALDARYRVMERFGYADERSYRRLKSGRRRTRGKPTP